MQLDLFSGAGGDPPRAASEPSPQQPLPILPADLSDETLIAAIPDAGRATCRALTEEAARRRLAQAIPALEALCRRFKGFGLHHAILEQTASLEALAIIGGADAAGAVLRIVTGDVVSGPGQREAVRAAATLRCVLPEPTATALLRHADPVVRVLACRCVPHMPAIPELLCSLLEDLNPGVATAAAMALGRRGRAEGRPLLLRLLRQAPGAELIDAVALVADEDCTVLLGRIARQRADLRQAVLAALEAIDSPRAMAILASLAGRNVSPAPA